MGKKRKTMATRPDEVDQTIHATFRNAAKSLSQLYTQCTSEQKSSFRAGQIHALEKLYQWISRQQEDDSTSINSTDILAYIQNELREDQPALLQQHNPNPYERSLNISGPDFVQNHNRDPGPNPTTSYSSH